MKTAVFFALILISSAGIAQDNNKSYGWDTALPAGYTIAMNPGVFRNCIVHPKSGFGVQKLVRTNYNFVRDFPSYWQATYWLTNDRSIRCRIAARDEDFQITHYTEERSSTNNSTVRVPNYVVSIGAMDNVQERGLANLKKQFLVDSPLPYLPPVTDGLPFWLGGQGNGSAAQ
jgi:hypothetical protein